MNSFVQQERGTKMQLPVTTIDSIVEELATRTRGLHQDGHRRLRAGGIEGRAEDAREIPAEADAGHVSPARRPARAPALIHEANPAYRAKCGPCEIENGRLLPHVTYFY